MTTSSKTSLDAGNGRTKAAVLYSLPLAAYGLAGLGFATSAPAIALMCVFAALLSVALAIVASHRFKECERDGLALNPSFAEEVGGGVVLLLAVLVAAGAAALLAVGWSFMAMIAAVAVFLLVLAADAVITTVTVLAANAYFKTARHDAIFTLAVAFQQRVGGALGDPLKR